MQCELSTLETDESVHAYVHMVNNYSHSDVPTQTIISLLSAKIIIAYAI